VINTQPKPIADPSELNRAIPLSDKEFRDIRDWLKDQSGIHLADIKKSMVVGRLQKRLRALQISSFAAYLKLILQADQSSERQTAVNLLTTNETYFFREEKHFQFLQQQVLPAVQSPNNFKVWSAAASTGEEAYSIALTLAQLWGVQSSWQVMGTDINTSVLQRAQKALYPMDAKDRIPVQMLKAFCLKGVGKETGWLKISDEVSSHVSFVQANLFTLQLRLPMFEVIFLRNVLIYFELEDKKKIIQNIVRQLKPGGWLLVGHSESIHGYHDDLKQHRPSCYQYLPANRP
jgi:chemotaxis protein methyltransferase CheR